MKQPINTVPLAQIQELVGRHIEHVKDQPDQCLLWMSMAEHLKDAARWQVVKNQDVVFYPGALPSDVERIVDKYLEEKKA